jgi:hypothetical protein
MRSQLTVAGKDREAAKDAVLLYSDRKKQLVTIERDLQRNNALLRMVEEFPLLNVLAINTKYREQEMRKYRDALAEANSNFEEEWPAWVTDLVQRAENGVMPRPVAPPQERFDPWLKQLHGLSTDANCWRTSIATAKYLNTVIAAAQEAMGDAAGRQEAMGDAAGRQEAMGDAAGRQEMHDDAAGQKVKVDADYDVSARCCCPGGQG